MSTFAVEFHKDVVEGADTKVQGQGATWTDHGRWVRGEFRAEHMTFDIDAAGVSRVSIATDRINVSIVLSDEDLKALNVRHLEQQLAVLKGGA